MTYHKHTFENGLRLITIPMPSVSSATVMFFVGAGSRYETPRTNGVTHFFEHMLFKGTKKRPSAESLSEVIDSIGGDWNAMTGKESTAYYIKTIAANLDKGFDILCDMLTGSLLDAKEIEREKTVIKSELAMYEDTPTRRVAEIFETLLYPDSSLGWDIGGDNSRVDGLARQDFLDLEAKFYVPKNIVVLVAGGIDEKKARELTARHLGTMKPVNGWSIPDATERFVQEEPRVMIREKKTEQAHLVLGWRGNPRVHKDRWVEEVLASILGGGMSSRLWVAVRERRGLAYYVRADLEHYRDNGYLGVAAGVEPKKIGEAIKVILEEVQNFVRGKKFTPEELKKGKEFVKGHLALSLEDTRSVAMWFGGFELFEDKILTPEDAFGGIDAVTHEDVLRVAGEFCKPKRLNLAVIGPYKERGEKFKSLIQ